MSNQSTIITLDGRPPAILDKDLAIQFQIPTKRLNEARSRNPQRFPDDFVFQLTDEECKSVRSQNATLPETVATWFNHNPWAYTEEGVAMMAGCIKSDAAAQASVYLIRMFRDARGVIQSQQATLNLMRGEMLKAKPLWANILRYKGMGLNHVEIAKLTCLTASTVRGHVRSMERLGLLQAPKALAKMQQYALHFAPHMKGAAERTAVKVH